VIAVDGPSGQRLREFRRQQRGDFGDTRLEMVVDPQQLAVRDLDLATDALAPRCAALEVGDPHDVVERHPEREVARGLAGDRPVAGSRSDRSPARPRRRGTALDVEVGVGGILVLVHAGMAERDEVECRGRKPRSEIRAQGR
jgi:hypothetical protein